MRPVLAAAETRLSRIRCSSFILLAFACASLAACANSQTVLTQLIEAGRLASELHVQFTQSAEAANRAVMAETDDMAAAAAEEARRARHVVERDTQTLRAILESLRYRDDSRRLDDFEARFKEYRRLDDEILPLAIENTNLKAQRLSFGPSREAAQSFQNALERAIGTSVSKETCCAEVVAARARMAVLEIQVMYAPHIAEAQDAAMTQMETQMTALAARTQKAVDELRGMLPSTARAQLDAAAAALNRFLSIHNEIITLSRRNSDVRSLALSLGEKRNVTAECEAHLQALEEALAKHEFTATR
jgi:negative regulator of replication initiation